MKNRFMFSLLVLITLLVFSNIILAASERGRIYPENILNIYKTEDDYISAGLKHLYKEGIYFGGNIEYQKNNGVDLEVNSVYMIPNIFIFDFYGGGGISLNLIHKELNPYLVLGSQFIFLFSETKYYLSNEEVEFRNGFKFEF